MSALGPGKARHERARPPGQVVVDRSGALLVADDVGNTVWRVAPATHAAEMINKSR